ncbi:MAG: hypothetical protein ACJ8MO_31095 [Bacillus sp. (in: firmicutes)]
MPIICVTKTSHIEDAIKATDVSLTAQEIRYLEAARKRNQ